MLDRAGQQFGNYRLLSLLGRGGFAEVYLGQHMRLNTQVAVKILHTRLSEEEAAKFLYEAQIIAQLDHPNIVRVFDFDDTDGIPFLVMNYYPRGTLRHRYHKGERVALPTVISLIQQVADALQYAHDRRLIHRDVKPENMLIGPRNEILLGDFGIAAVAHSTSSMSAQLPTGTLPYMAPEQIQAQARPASDQYALAVVAYEWLCGERPFSGTSAEILSKHLMTPPPSLRARVPTLPHQVEQVLMVALAKDPKQRFASVLAFAQALEAACQGRPTSPLQSSVVSADSTILPLVKPSRPHTTVSPPPTIAVPPIGTEPVPSMTSPRSASEIPRYELASQRNSPFYHPLTSAQLPSLPHGIESARRDRFFTRRKLLVSGLVMATGLVVTGAGVAASKLIPYLNSLPAVYSGHTSGVLTMAWSPDGTRIVSGDGDGSVQIWTAADRKQLMTKQFYEAGKDGFGNTEYSPVELLTWFGDGTHIGMCFNYGDAPFIWDTLKNTRVVSFPLGSGSSLSMSFNSFGWSPDAKYLAVASSGPTSVTSLLHPTIYVLDTTNGHVVATYSQYAQGTELNQLSWSPDSTRVACASDDGTVQVWRARNAVHLLTFTSPPVVDNSGGSSPGKTLTAAWSPDGKYLASGGDNALVSLWDAASGKVLFTFHGHTDQVNTVAWSPDGKKLASGSSDQTVQIWSTADGKHITTLSGHTQQVNTLAWSPDGTLLASGSNDKTIRIWKMEQV